MRYLPNGKNWRACFGGLVCIVLMLSAVPARADCPAVPGLFEAQPDKLLTDLSATSEKAWALLQAMDTYSVAMESCYDSPMGPLEIAPFAQQAALLAEKMHIMRDLAEANVRGDEFAFEDLLSSDLWRDIESLRVASAYAAAWGQLARAVRHISANEKRQALIAARADLQKLTFEFKHPVLVQRAMYGMAVAQVENGDVALAQATLERLLSSLKRNDAGQFQAAVQAFFDDISAPGFQPPLPALLADAAGADSSDGQAPPLVASGAAGNAALQAAISAIQAARPADEIAMILQPAMQAEPIILRQALALVAGDRSLLEALDYQPGTGLRQMRNGFATQKYTVVREGWRGVKPYYPHLPAALKRQVDYQMGASQIGLGDLTLALTHLRAALVGLADGPERTRIEQLIVLAQLSSEEPPNAARLALAKSYQNAPLTSPDPSALAPVLAMRARIVLARQAAAERQWAAADRLLSGFGPEMPAYQLFLGMRVRLLAQAVADGAENAPPSGSLRKQAQGGQVLYGLWLSSQCPPGCLSGDRLAVHRAAIDLALKGDLDGDKFGIAWGTFEAEGGDTRPLVPQALSYLVRKNDADRLTALLDLADEGRSALVLGQWKKRLDDMQADGSLADYYDFLDLGVDGLQGRPRAVLLEALIEFNLNTDRAQRALDLADALAKDFPRRPNAWFLRAAALTALDRGLEAARALASLARRTPADDPVGMGARIGLAAVFLTLDKAQSACAMQAKVFSRPQAPANWKKAVEAFPQLHAWGVATQSQCASATN